MGDVLHGSIPTFIWQSYILFTVDYVSKWVKEIAFPSNNSKGLSKFLKKQIFKWSGTPIAIISDGGTYFINQTVKNLLTKYGVRHKVAIAYHHR